MTRFIIWTAMILLFPVILLVIVGMAALIALGGVGVLLAALLIGL